MKLTDVNGKVVDFYRKLTITPYEKQHGVLSYNNMLEVFGDGCYILNDKLAEKFEFDFVDENWSECEELTIYQYYIISEYTADQLRAHTNEVILYSADLDMYLLGVGHFGTSWDYILTDIKFEE